MIPDFADRYLITTVRGRIYDYPMMLEAAMQRLRTSPFTGMKETPRRTLRLLAIEALHDDAFMRRLGHMIPARVAEEIEDRIWGQVFNKSHPLTRQA